MKGLEDIAKDKDLQARIRWELKPISRVKRSSQETEEDMKRIRKQFEERVGLYFFVEVIFGNIALYLYENYPDGSGKYVAEITDLPHELLVSAVKETGGSIDKDGRYSINSQIESWLKARFDSENK